MAKKASKRFSIADAYAAQQAMQGAQGGGDPDNDGDGSGQQQADPSQGGQPLTIQPSDVAQLEQLKQQGDQSGDYSALGKAFAQILDANDQSQGGGQAAQQPGQ